MTLVQSTIALFPEIEMYTFLYRQMSAVTLRGKSSRWSGEKIIGYGDI